MPQLLKNPSSHYTYIATANSNNRIQFQDDMEGHDECQDVGCV